MTTNLTTTDNLRSIESVLIQGDLSQLSQADRLSYYSRLCESLGLNPLNEKRNRWTAVCETRKVRGGKYLLCVCDCGTVKEIFSGNFWHGKSKFCGCFPCKGNTKHGLKDLPEYKIWKSIRDRCYNPKTHSYKDYGGRGITLSPQWNDFAFFYRDMGPRPSPSHEIDRIDNNGSYCKENTRWATRTENANNKRSNRLFTIDGETKTMAEWIEFAGITRSAFKARLKGGWSLHDIVHTPLVIRNRQPGRKS